jgi:hypothetical protein
MIFNFDEFINERIENNITINKKYEMFIEKTNPIKFKDYYIGKIESFDDAKELGSHYWDIAYSKQYWDTYNNLGDIYYIFKDNKLYLSAYKRYKNNEVTIYNVDNRIEKDEELKKFIEEL